jgi:hypothetical protein
MAGKSMTAQPGLALSAADEARGLLADFTAMLGIDDGGRECIERLPNSAERGVLRRRAGELEKSIEGIGRAGPAYDRARQALAALLGGYSALSRADVDGTLGIMLGWLGDMPLDAIAETCRLVGTGKAMVVDPATSKPAAVGIRFPPTHVEMHILCGQFVEARRTELAQIEKVLRVARLAPPPVSDAERDRVRDGFAELSLSLKRVEPADDERSARMERRRIELAHRSVEREYAFHGLEPVERRGLVVSLSLLLSQGWKIVELNPGEKTLVSPSGIFETAGAK